MNGSDHYFILRCQSYIIKEFQKSGMDVQPAEIRAGGVPEADIAVPVFRRAKVLKKDAAALAESIVKHLELTASPFASARALKGYVNLKFNPEALAEGVFADYQRDPERYGAWTLGQGKTVVIDYSSPNIAKPFSVGHLRSTIIGQALYNIFSFLGYKVVGDNHLGDWGTQFGKLLCAFELWGDEKKLAQNPTGYLLELYVQFHEKAKMDKTLEAKAREWFRRLETGDPKTRTRWQEFVQLSRKEFDRIYQLLGVSFDLTLGESFYADRLPEVIERALKKNVARAERPPETVQSGEEDVSQNEKVVLIPLDSMGLKVPLLLQKSDGTSLYAARELATYEYRVQTYQPEKILYVVGNEQEFYFKQFNAALKLLGYDVPCIHVNFGLIRLPEGRLSTREGRVIFLLDVINEAIDRAKAVLVSRDLSQEEKETIARKVGIGAIKYADLSQNRVKDVVFDWDRMLSLDGDSAPYLLYAYTRTRSIFRKAPTSLPPPQPKLLTTPEELTLLKHIAWFPLVVRAAAETYQPHRVANHLYRLAQDFSTFYDRIPVLKADKNELVSTRLALVEMAGTVLKTGLKLLGIEVTERM
ncbi:MAG: arginine--tRNA ligase [candidate division WOR-3 bacterium]